MQFQNAAHNLAESWTIKETLHALYDEILMKLNCENPHGSPKSYTNSAALGKEEGTHAPPPVSPILPFPAAFDLEPEA